MPDGPVKIGVTVNIPERLRHLQTGSHEELAVIWHSFGDAQAERRLHTMFSKFRKRYEWFDLGDMSNERIALCLTRAKASRSTLPIENLPEWPASWPNGL
jgi:hypothetical protein